jgi:Tol biopolymer transport system component
LSLTAGTRLGPYQIESALGAGGMGQVYKARDTRLDRVVAIKVLAPDLAADPEFRQRFDREARAISQLSHPNICTLHDVGQHDGTAFLVMELLDGQTLADRLSGVGRASSEPGLQVPEALTIAIQIGEALAAAHRAGLVHRDLKPGNVMLTKVGAKLLDFGLAKHGAGRAGQAGGVIGSVRPQPDLTAMATTPPAMTAQGMIVGTFQYMAPEQIEGHDADARSDIFAFGCVLYEMLAGRKAFEGKSHASLIGAIMHADPPILTSLMTPSPLATASLDRIVAKCLAKDPDARWQSARDLADELKWIAGPGAAPPASSTVVSAPAPVVKSSRLVWAAGTIAAIATLAAVAMGLALAAARRAPDRPAVSARFTIAMPEGWTINSATAPAGAAALSPDGKYFVITGTVRDETPGLWLRAIDAVEVRRIPHTEYGTLPFWSPDSQSLGFYDTATRQLKRTTINGDAVSVICEATNPQGADWNRDGVIAFAANSGIMRVDASGGTPVLVARRGAGQPSLYAPQFLSDGRRFVYAVFGTGAYVSLLDGTDQKIVANAPTQPMAIVGDDALFVRGATLVSQRLDTAKLALVGEPVSVLSGVSVFSVTPTVLAYGPPRASADELRWFDRAGQRIGLLGDRGDYSNLELSPDGSRLAVAMMDPRVRTRDIWVYDVTRGIRQRFTFSDAEERTAVWSHDGAHLLYNVRGKGGTLDFFQKPADGSGVEEPVLVDGLSKDPLGWSPDGSHLLYRVTGGSTGNDLLALPASGDRKSIPISTTPFDEQDGRISPDGGWVAYATDESGQTEVYVAKFPSGGGKARISVAGGTHPRWRHDGRELFYVSLDSKLVSVDVSVTASEVRVGGSRPLFAIPAPRQFGYNFDVTANGQRFIVINDVSVTPLPVVVTNWKSQK